MDDFPHVSLVLVLHPSLLPWFERCRLSLQCAKDFVRYRHWEGDLMQFRTQRGNLLTLCERKTRFSFTAPLPSKKADSQIMS